MHVRSILVCEIFMYTYALIRTYAYVSARVHMRGRGHMWCIGMNVHVYTRITITILYIMINIDACMHICVHARVHVRKHAHAHACAYVHVHVYRRVHRDRYRSRRTAHLNIRFGLKLVQECPTRIQRRRAVTRPRNRPLPHYYINTSPRNAATHFDRRITPHTQRCPRKMN